MTSTYTYDINANGVTPTAVYANGTQIFRLQANGTDVIHKINNYKSYVTSGIKFTVSVSNVYKESTSHCGVYDDKTYGRATVKIEPVIVSYTGDATSAVLVNSALATDQQVDLKIYIGTPSSSAGVDWRISANATGDYFQKSFNFIIGDIGTLSLYAKSSFDDFPFKCSYQYTTTDGKTHVGFAYSDISSDSNYAKICDIPLTGTSYIECGEIRYKNPWSGSANKTANSTRDYTDQVQEY